MVSKALTAMVLITILFTPVWAETIDEAGKPPKVELVNPAHNENHNKNLEKLVLKLDSMILCPNGNPSQNDCAAEGNGGSNPQ